MVPTHDRATRLSELLDSLRAQTLDPERFEVVVVDNWSSDETPAVLEGQRARPGLRLRTLRRESPDGPAAARNDGWHAAEGGLVAFIDDDCVAAPEWLEEALQACARHHGTIIQGRVDPIPAERHRESPATRTQRIHQAGPYYQTCNIVYPRQLLEELGGFDAAAFTIHGGEDTDLAWRAISRGTPTAFAERAQAYHAINRIGLTGRLRLAWHWTESMLVYKRFPELRDDVFTRRVFWKQSHYALFRAAIVLFLPRRLAFLSPLVLRPYVRSVLIRRHVEGGSAAHALFYPLEDLVEVGAMVRASIRYRMLVL